MVIIENNKIELALYIIELKKAQIIKNNRKKSYEEFQKEMNVLIKEKQEIYKQNEKIIDKVLTKYLKEVK